MNAGVGVCGWVDVCVLGGWLLVVGLFLGGVKRPNAGSRESGCWIPAFFLPPPATTHIQQGKMETKTQKQCKDYIRPLFKLCKAKQVGGWVGGCVLCLLSHHSTPTSPSSLTHPIIHHPSSIIKQIPDGIRSSIVEMVEFCEQGEFVKVNPGRFSKRSTRGRGAHTHTSTHTHPHVQKTHNEHHKNHKPTHDRRTKCTCGRPSGTRPGPSA